MYASMPKVSNSNRLIDLRSDTVTRPSAGMREAMANAEVGDDVYGDDPTVNALEERAAEMMGKEAGLFVSSGTQSNLVALLTHCGRGDEYIGGVGYHIPKYEAGGAAVLGGISPRHLPLNNKGGLDPDAIEAAIQPDDSHFAITKLVCLENTHNGLVMDQDDIEKTAEVARRHGLGLHIDGARLMNAAVKSGRPASELVTCADTVSLCLSKGLGAPVGSVLCGPKDFVHQARRARKLVGGGLRQSGVLAACGLYALHNNVERMAEDHQNAAAMAKRLAELSGLTFDVDSVHTNMIWIDVEEGSGAGSLSDHMMGRGMIVSEPSGPERRTRLVTHLDFEAGDVDKVVDGFAAWLGE
ncbi:MAG: low-specificity L-threonine aldolase [Rhizobiaceae bacterium]